MAFTRKELNTRKRLKHQELLGMPYSTATYRLYKLLLFDLLQKLGMDNCHRCDKKLNRGDISVEHIGAWQSAEDATAAFFDIKNISFSHLRCNMNAAKKGGWNKGRITHGSSGYRLGCRCDVCVGKYSEVRRKKYIRKKN